MAVATAYLTDITPEAQRAQRFGLFHVLDAAAEDAIHHLALFFHLHLLDASKRLILDSLALLGRACVLTGPPSGAAAAVVKVAVTGWPTAATAGAGSTAATSAAATRRATTGWPAARSS